MMLTYFVTDAMKAYHVPQDLFDITFCYFPITFTPPPNDPYGISSEDLQISLRYASNLTKLRRWKIDWSAYTLRACLSATPRFGPLALPLFIEKLQASTNTAKVPQSRICISYAGKAS